MVGLGKVKSQLRVFIQSPAVAMLRERKGGPRPDVFTGHNKRGKKAKRRGGKKKNVGKDRTKDLGFISAGE